MNNHADRSARIRALNDRLRTTLTGGTVLVSSGVARLGPEAQARILAAVQAFDAFTTDNDPWGEHDFGALEVEIPERAGGVAKERVFFKIDTFDLTRARHADDPTDPNRTERVLTVLLADEY